MPQENVGSGGTWTGLWSRTRQNLEMKTFHLWLSGFRRNSF